MDMATRASSLVRFLLDRPPSRAEQEQIDSFGFDCDTFFIRLLCSDEAASRYGDVTQHFVDHVRQEMAADVLPHKLAHDLVLSKEELAKLQARLDRLNGQMIEVLKQEDRIAGLFDGLRAIQADFRTVRERLDRMEGSMLRGVGVGDDR
jgi:hypothetical protein